MRLRRILVRALLYAALAVGTYVFIWPLLWLVTSSVKASHEIYSFPPSLIPEVWHWEYIPDAMSKFSFMRSFLVTMTIVVGVTIGRLLSCSLTAFAFARIRVPGRDALFIVVLATMMLPYHVTLIPQYLLFKELGWLNTVNPLIVPSFFGTTAYLVFLLRQFFMTIPFDYDEAAQIDGCSLFGIFFRIVLPLSMPALGVVMILTFMGEWNDFLAPLIYLNDLDKMTLAVALRSWHVQQNQPGGVKHPEAYIMVVATVITFIPMLVFFLAQRYFIQGVVISGVKG
jgi:ABC-type glycerol-3-phosphate transport system permease component